MPKSILIIDDNQELLQTLSCTLQVHNFLVLEATSAYEAENMLKDHHVDVIVTDIFMPERDGTQFIADLRQNGADDRPIIAISGGGQELTGSDALNLAASLGADAVLYKPFSGIELVNAIEGCLKSSGRPSHERPIP